MANDERLRKSPDQSRQSRVLEDRALGEDRQRTDTEEQRRRSLRNEFLHSALPTAPEIPGYQCFYASTTHQYDHIANRLRLGYELVKPEECPPGWAAHTIRTGQYEGAIGINEMLLLKLPNDRYEEIMQDLHHDAPLEEEERLKTQTETLADTLRRHGSRAMIGEGTAELGMATHRPRFTP